MGIYGLSVYDDVGFMKELTLFAAFGNLAASSFIEIVCEILHFFDDVADKDKWIEGARVQEACWRALVVLPRNSFYRENFAELNPLIASAIQNWGTANEMEQGDDDDALRIAFVIRSTYANIVIHVATICGGFEHGNEVSKRARELWHGEGYEAYLKSLASEKMYQRADLRRFED